MSEATKVKASKTTTKTTKAKLATVKVTVPHTSEVKRTKTQVLQLRYDEMLAYAMDHISEGVECDTDDQFALVTDGLTKVAASTVAKSGILDTLRQSGLPHTHLFAPMKSKKEQIPNPNSTCPSQAFYDACIALASRRSPTVKHTVRQQRLNYSSPAPIGTTGNSSQPVSSRMFEML